MNTKAKVKIYITAVTPIIIYGVGVRADTTRTEQLLSLTEIRTMRSILGKTLWDKIRNKDIRDECEIKKMDRYWN